MTLPKGYGSGGKRAPPQEETLKETKAEDTGIDRNIIVACIAICITIASVGVVVYFQIEKTGNDKEAEEHRIFWLVIIISTGLTAVLFYLCIKNYVKVRYYPYRIPFEEKQHVLDNIFGILAGLAITTALLTYFDNYLVLLNLTSFNDFPLSNLTPEKLQSLGYFIPTLHLIDFFVVAIPLTHSGYRFLASVANSGKSSSLLKVNGRRPKWFFAFLKQLKAEDNTPFRLMIIFIISIILIAILFFLGGSIAMSEEEVLTAGTGNSPIEKSINVGHRASTGFVFWLILTVGVTIAWSVVIRSLRIIDESPQKEYGEETGKKKISERIHKEWILLDVITLGFLVSIASTIFYLELIDDGEMDTLLYFNSAMSAVLVTRAILNYHLGRDIYFPKAYQEPSTRDGH